VESIEPGAIYLVSTPIGNLADITYRAVHILKSVDIIAAEDTRVTSVLLNHYGIQKRSISFHSYNQRTQTQNLVKKVKDGYSLALVSDAGTPGISDPAYYLVNAALNADIRLIPIPGASAFLAALVVSGLPCNKFIFEGFLPLKKGRKKRIKVLGSEGRTIIFYESPHRIHRTVSEIHEGWGDRHCVMGRELTKKFEEFYRGKLSDLKAKLEEKQVKGEIVLIVAGNDKDL
jgi:16S rRNA (cytidine1402-2'-O)-methyltransferase